MQEQILDALRRGDSGQALAAARDALQADPDNARNHLLMALALRAADDRDAAIESIDRALALAPDDADLHFQRAGLLLGARDLEGARQGLAQTIELDPNQFGAYLVQAELALGRGDLDEAEQAIRAAARLAPEHPVIDSIEAMVALGRDDRKRALALASRAAERAPDNPQVLNALGFVYMGNAHYAFAEQAFRRLRERTPDNPAIGRMLAELLFRQQRWREALDELEPSLSDAQPIAPESRRFAGELALRIDEPERALRWLRSALASLPDDARTLALAMQAWQRLGDAQGARNALEAALSTSPQVAQLWRARFTLEQTREGAQAVLDRWTETMPDAIDVLEAKLMMQRADGDVAAAEATLHRIVERMPGNLEPEGRLLDLIALRDPHEAVQRIEGLLQAPGGDAPERRGRLHGWLARLHDRLGDYARAARLWEELHAGVAGRMVPPPEPSVADAARAPAAPVPEQAPPIAFLAGLPGSGVERAARLLDGVVTAFRADRFGQTPPRDPLQNARTIADLGEGRIQAEDIAAQWRSALPARGLSADGAAIDWLLWWDNALLDVVGPHLPQAHVLIALRDPRDMLLDWLAFGSRLPLRLASAREGAQWLAAMLEHVAVLHERDLHRHVLLRLDEAIDAPAAMAGLLSEALATRLPEPPAGLFAGTRFEAGRWRRYGQALGDAFATLTPVAIRLGYPES